AYVGFFAYNEMGGFDYLPYGRDEAMPRRERWEMEMSKRVAALREERGLSQERLAKEAGISVWTLRRWEQRGQTPLVKVLVQVARVLEVSLDDLVGYTPPAKKIRKKGGA